MRLDSNLVALKMKTRPAQKTTPTTATPTRTEPSRTCLGASSSSSAGSDDLSFSSARRAATEKETSASQSSPVLVEDDLFAFPPDLHPVYRRLPWLVQVLIAGIVGNIILIRDSSLQSEAIRKGFHLLFVKGPVYALTALMLQLQQASWGATWRWFRWLVAFVVRYTILTTLPLLLLQERFRRPSRISARDLQEQYFLPSTLSRFEKLPVQVQNVSTTVGLHWLEYRNNNIDVADDDGDEAVVEDGQPRKILHCSHGFGASSLSWLPCLKPLTEKLGCCVGLAHDKLGFGFSEPPEENFSTAERLFWYTNAGSSRMVASLLQRQSSSLRQGDSLVLVGHSMGALTTLRLALELPQDTPKKIILVAPALGLRKLKKYDKQTGKNAFSPVSWVLGRSGQFVLRRVVGIPGFWRNGLKGAWGDANKLKDSDVLRFQWPSLHKGWEAGLLCFVKASGLAIAGYDNLGPLSDQDLLTKVLALPSTTVEVILGEKDRIIAPANMRKFLVPFPSVHIQELPGLGHDPFEEDVEAFLHAIDRDQNT